MRLLNAMEFESVYQNKLDSERDVNLKQFKSA